MRDVNSAAAAVHSHPMVTTGVEVTWPWCEDGEVPHFPLTCEAVLPLLHIYNGGTLQKQIYILANFWVTTVV